MLSTARSSREIKKPAPFRGTGSPYAVVALCEAAPAHRSETCQPQAQKRNGRRLGYGRKPRDRNNRVAEGAVRAIDVPPELGTDLKRHRLVTTLGRAP